MPFEITEIRRMNNIPIAVLTKTSLWRIYMNQNQIWKKVISSDTWRGVSLDFQTFTIRGQQLPGTKRKKSMLEMQLNYG